MRLLSLVSGIFILSFFACAKPDDQAIRELIAQMEKEAEALDWNAFQSHISRHYKDDSGNNYFIIFQIIKNYTQGLDSLEAEVEILGISIRGENAEAQLKLIARGMRQGKISYIVGREDLPEYPRLKFQKEGRNWRLIKVEGIKSAEESPW